MTELKLCIPTYRPRKVVETVRAYDEHFSRYGHDVPIFVFDDSPGDQAAEFLDLALGQTHNPVYVIGATEKAETLERITERAAQSPGDAELVRALLRPSFGGNRNNILLYTLGSRFISVDDDIRPYGIVSQDFNRRETNPLVVIRGRPVAAEAENQATYESDIAAEFDRVLGKKVAQLSGYLRGDHVVDRKSDLYRNQSRKVAAEQTRYVLVRPEAQFPFATIKMAETGLTGADDLDTLDFLYFFLNDADLSEMTEPSKTFILDTYRPFVTKNNWKTACGVSGYDNTEGLPAFFPTRLRFEDYAYRLWTQRNDFASCHINAIQYHDRDGHERPNAGQDILNEAFANYLKDKLRESLQEISDIHMVFTPDRRVDSDEVTRILDSARDIYYDVMRAAKKVNSSARRAKQLDIVAASLLSEFEGFAHDRFLHKMSHTVSSELDVIVQTQEIWPSCVEAAADLHRRGALPVRLLRKGVQAKCG
jgi:hypothetical protein